MAGIATVILFPVLSHCRLYFTVLQSNNNSLTRKKSCGLAGETEESGNKQKHPCPKNDCKIIKNNNKRGIWREAKKSLKTYSSEEREYYHPIGSELNPVRSHPVVEIHNTQILPLHTFSPHWKPPPLFTTHCCIK